MIDHWSGARAAILLLALAACGKPEWTDPDKSQGTAAAPPATVAAAVPSNPGVPRTSEGAPAHPAWLTAVIGQNPRSAFPRAGVCQGNIDLVILRYDGSPPGSKLLGWGWDMGAKRAVDRVILVDAGYTIVGGGEGGVARPDVAASQRYVNGPSGWHAVTPMISGPVDAYGVVDGGRAICPLGHLVL